MTGRLWPVLGLVLAPLALAAFFAGPIWARFGAADPDPGRRTGAMYWADRAGGVPVLGPDGAERRVPYRDLDRIRHGACLRTVVTVWAPVHGARDRQILGGLPFPMARVTHRCLVTARDRTTEQTVQGIVRLVEDPTQIWPDQGMLSGPGLPAALTALRQP